MSIINRVGGREREERENPHGRRESRGLGEKSTPHCVDMFLNGSRYL